ncbi:MAG: ABC transporter permease [Bdellovibrionota bacterium]
MNFFQNYRWVPHVLSIELKKAFSYRVAFWVQFLLGTGTELSVAYFLWRAIFENQHVTTMQGFTFHGILYYYLFASFAGKITRGADRGYLAQDIYDGSLTRYFLYPLSFLGFKFATHLTQQLLGVCQLVIALAFLTIAIGGNHAVSPASFAAGCFTCLLTGYLHFNIMSCLEMVAFWQDVVWNLVVMLRFSMNFLGGALIPLVFFPAWGQHLVSLTPFPILVAFPARVFLGEVTLHEWVINVALLGFWSVVFTFLAREVWLRGTRQYSGVGI